MPRSFGSLQVAADEATLSQIFAGQHTMIDFVAGRQLGCHVGDFVLRHFGSAPLRKARSRSRAGPAGTVPAAAAQVKG